MATGDFLARIKLALEGKDKVVAGLTRVQTTAQKLSKTKVTSIFDAQGIKTGQQIEETFSQVSDKSKKATAGADDFMRALKRAAIVAPVWMALRSVMTGTLQLLSAGFRTWEEFDKILIKSKAVVHDYADSTGEAMTELEDTIRTFSKESGIALKDVASAFYRFGTVGIAFSDALSGAVASAKLAKATLGDTDTISKSLAMTYRLLGDSIDSTLSPMQKQEALAGKILHLWKTNAFESNEFAASLNNFVSTANIANFTADQTVSTLAALGTAGVQGSRGGALLKTSIQKLVENLDKLAPTLGLAVNPEMETTFDLFMRVLGAINKLSQTKGIPKEALQSINEIFGGVRGGQVISALNALLPELQKNLTDLGKNPQEYIKGLNDRFKEVNDTVSGQMDIFRNLRDQVGEAFVKGIFGAEDFKDSLIKANALMEQLIVVARNVGDGLRNLYPPELIKSITKDGKQIEANFQRIEDARAGILSLADTIESIELAKKLWGDTDYGRYVIQQVEEAAQAIAKEGAFQERVAKEIKKYNDEVIKTENEKIDKEKQLSVLLQDKLGTSQAELQALRLQAAGASEMVVAHTKLEGLLTTLVDRYNGLKDASGKTVANVSKQEVLAAIMAGDFTKLQDIFKEMKLTEEELTTLINDYHKINKAVLADLDKRVSTISTILKITGEEESAIIKQEMALKAMMFDEEYLKNNMDDRLKLAQALTKEAEEQNKKSAHAVELAKILRKYGVQTAQEIADYQGGAKAFDELSSTAKEALKKFVPSSFEQEQATQDITRAGIVTPEAIQKEVTQQRNMQILNQVMIDPIELNVSLDSDAVIQAAKDAIVKELDDLKSPLSKKFEGKIKNY